MPGDTGHELELELELRLGDNGGRAMSASCVTAPSTCGRSAIVGFPTVPLTLIS